MTAPARTQARGRGAAGGFTLIELMVTVALVAVLLALAAPSFSDASVNSKLSDTANRLLSSTSFSRGEAIKRNAHVVMCKSADGATCTTSGGWEQGWIVFHDADRDAALDTDENVLAKEPAAPGGYKVTTAANTLSFLPTSVGISNTTWTICRATPSVSSQQREVKVNPTGRGTVSKVTGATSCS
jgi:type IV fimbrial biogenesis protein FimT